MENATGYEWFMERVEIDETTGDWVWVGAYPAGSPYGTLYFEGRTQKAHRIAWQLFRGPIPDGMMVLHDCPHGDNPSCVNPNHLFLGDGFANMQDAARKGRINTQKLTLDDRNDIIALYATGAYTQQALAAMYGVNRTTISRIVRRERWGWADELTPDEQEAA